MGDAIARDETPRNIIVSSTLPKQQEEHTSPETAVHSTTPELPGQLSQPQPQLSESMATTFVHQPFDAHQHQRFDQSPFVPIPPVPAPGPTRVHHPVHANAFAMAGMSRPPGPGFAPPSAPLTRQSSQQRFQTGPSAAAVAYQISQQIQRYQGGVGSSQEPTTHLYTAPSHQPTFYDSYGQGYTYIPPDPTLRQHGDPFQAYTAGYGTPYLQQHGTASSGQQWYPHQQNQYYFMQPTYAASPMAAVQPMPMGLSYTSPGPVEDNYRSQNIPAKPFSFPRRTSAAEDGFRQASVAESNLPGGSFGSQTGGEFDRHSTPRSKSLPTGHSLPRGPPRKPKQSGNALWVGNLPIGTNVVDLKDYFSRNATSEIESVFLISKSNCAFVNYRTEAACNAALQQFHDSRFQNTRLVCRLRRSTTPTPAATPQMMSSSDDSNENIDRASASASQATNESGGSTEIATVKSPPIGPSGGKTPRTVGPGKDRYFIVKSLTVEDLDLSAKNGVWATQSHNESTFNQAFQTADNVYLIFSANKSGEYYGYARMISPITNDPSKIDEWVPAPQKSVESELPKAIFTPATQTAPKGRIIDDSARGTIFWEALEGDETAEGAQEGAEGRTQSLEAEQAVSSEWGKPFKVEWLSTARLPFYRTRGLRNQWNSNREVKIARDGTELEENVGKKLIQMFHRNGTPAVYGRPGASGAAEN